MDADAFALRYPGFSPVTRRVFLRIAMMSGAVSGYDSDGEGVWLNGWLIALREHERFYARTSMGAEEWLRRQ